MTELERLEKEVVDTDAADYAAYAVAEAAVAEAAADADSLILWIDSQLAADNAGRAYAAWVKARLELNNYLKEQDDD